MAISVLIVYPRTPEREGLEAHLTQMRCRITSIETTDEGIETYRKGGFDMVFVRTEVTEDDKDGLECARRIREGSGEQWVPLLVLVPPGGEVDLRACAAVGVNDFIRMPHSPDETRFRIGALMTSRGFWNMVVAQEQEISRKSASEATEQRMAEKVLSHMVHRGIADCPNIHKHVSPMQVFNGDLILTAYTPSGATRILLADFTGHGLTAAFGSLPLTEIFSSMTSKGFSISELVQELNRKLRALLPTGMFCACIVYDISPGDESLTIWNGGMHDVLVRAKRGGLRMKLESEHLALGILDKDFDDSCQQYRLEDGDRLLAYSDGVLEAADAAGEMFGQARLEETFEQSTEAASFVATLMKRVREHSASPQSDDITLIEYVYHHARAQAAAPRLGPYAIPKPASTWSAQLSFEADCLRTVDPMPVVMQLLMSIQGLEAHRSNLHMIVTELFNNALHHGVLEIDGNLRATPVGFSEYFQLRTERLAKLVDGSIQMQFSHRPSPKGGALEIIISDSGAGFVRKKAVGAGPGLFGGRGIGLVESLCEELIYEGRGNVVRATYAWT